MRDPSPPLSSLTAPQSISAAALLLAQDLFTVPLMASLKELLPPATSTGANESGIEPSSDSNDEKRRKKTAGLRFLSWAQNIVSKASAAADRRRHVRCLLTALDNEAKTSAPHVRETLPPPSSLLDFDYGLPLPHTLPPFPRGNGWWRGLWKKEKGSSRTSSAGPSSPTFLNSTPISPVAGCATFSPRKQLEIHPPECWVGTGRKRRK